jgi:hypothetical protein
LQTSPILSFIVKFLFDLEDAQNVRKSNKAHPFCAPQAGAASYRWKREMKNRTVLTFCRIQTLA